MAEAGIPQDVQALIASSIDSVEQLEVLLLLHGSGGREWRAADVSGALSTTEPSAARCLASLAQSGLLRADDEIYRYEPRPELRPPVDALSRIYSRYRVRIIQLIFSAPTGNVQSFADAFRIRRKP